MERIFKCATCGKELMFWEICQLPGKEVYDKIYGLSYNTALNYCQKCYDKMTGRIETPDLIKENRDLFIEYLKIKSEWDKLNRKKEELNNKIKDIMVKNNLPKTEVEGKQFMIWKTNRVYYPKKEIEEKVNPEILDKIRNIKQVICLRMK